MKVINYAAEFYARTSTMLNILQPPTLLGARIYVAWIFFTAGLTKIKDWDTTLWLFEEEYSVPLIPFELAAFLGTTAELIFPILLILGLCTRISALGLTVVNIVAVISLTEIAPAAYILHVLWALLLILPMVFGAGKLSTDYLLKKKFNLYFAV